MWCARLQPGVHILRRATHDAECQKHRSTRRFRASRHGPRPSRHGCTLASALRAGVAWLTVACAPCCDGPSRRRNSMPWVLLSKSAELWACALTKANRWYDEVGATMVVGQHANHPCDAPAVPCAIVLGMLNDRTRSGHTPTNHRPHVLFQASQRCDGPHSFHAGATQGRAGT